MLARYPSPSVPWCWWTNHERKNIQSEIIVENINSSLNCRWLKSNSIEERLILPFLAIRFILLSSIGLFPRPAISLAAIQPISNHNFYFFISDTFTRRRSHSNARNVGRVSVSREPWLFTRSCIWRNHRTSVQCAIVVSISVRIWRPICWHTPTTSPTSAPRAARCSEGIVIWGDMLSLMPLGMFQQKS